MNKLIIDGTEYELNEPSKGTDYFKRPMVMINEKIFFGDLITAAQEPAAKDYEILAFGPRPDCDGYILRKNLNCGFGPYGADEADLIKSRFPIHSVKRLSDGQIFSVGDIQTYGVIVRFLQTPYSVNAYFTNGCGANIDSLDPVRKPLFTTEDGVEIFEGGECWVLEESSNHIYVWEKVCKDGKGAGEKYFSTQQAAQLYVLKNKQCLSYMDMLNFTDAIQHADLMKYVKKKVNV